MWQLSTHANRSFHQWPPFEHKITVLHKNCWLLDSNPGLWSESSAVLLPNLLHVELINYQPMLITSSTDDLHFGHLLADVALSFRLRHRPPLSQVQEAGARSVGGQGEAFDRDWYVKKHCYCHYSILIGNKNTTPITLYCYITILIGDITTTSITFVVILTFSLVIV